MTIIVLVFAQHMQYNLLIPLDSIIQLILLQRLVITMRHQDTAWPIQISLLALHRFVQIRDICPVVHREALHSWNIMVNINRAITFREVELDDILRFRPVIQERVYGQIHRLGDIRLDLLRSPSSDPDSYIGRSRGGNNIRRHTTFHPAQIDSRDTILLTLRQILTQLHQRRQSSREHFIRTPSEPGVAAMRRLPLRLDLQA